VQGKIGRDDVADLCLHLLQNPSARGVTFEVKSQLPMSVPWEGPSDGSEPCNNWRALLGEAQLRPGVTGKTIDGVYTGTNTEAEALEHMAVSV
jgi:hypothetical protein